MSGASADVPHPATAIGAEEAGVAIRTATQADAAALARLFLTSWRAAYRGIMPDDFLDALSVTPILTRWERLLADPGGATVLVEADDSLHGFASFGRTRDADEGVATGELHALYVDPDRWHHGVGTALGRAALAKLGAGGYREATVWVLEANVRARCFYERMGFRLEPGACRLFSRRQALPEVRYRRRLRKADHRMAPGASTAVTEVAQGPVSVRGEVA
jgi:GNAT superfamily N-acetyltransferase